MSGIYNVGSGKGVEVKNLIQIIDMKINNNDNLTLELLKNIDANKRNQNFYSCTKKINELLNNFMFTSIDSGIKSLIKIL